jgi:hypothetical protein
MNRRALGPSVEASINAPALSTNSITTRRALGSSLEASIIAPALSANSIPTRRAIRNAVGKRRSADQCYRRPLQAALPATPARPIGIPKKAPLPAAPVAQLPPLPAAAPLLALPARLPVPAA